jgi:hypothetical protein
MLNSDQTVQDLIDAHRKKQAESAAAGARANAEARVAPRSSWPALDVTPKGPSVAPLSGLPGAPKSVLQPPRAGSPRRRMGGTMLGVAPQVGGVTPPRDDDAAAAAPGPETSGVSDAEGKSPTPSTAEVIAEAPGDAGKQTLAPAAGTARPAPAAVEVQRPPAPTLTPALDVPERGEPSTGTVAPAAQHELDQGGVSIRLAATAAHEAVIPARAGVAATTAMPAQPVPSAGGELSASASARPRAQRVRPFEVALIVATCGLYGIFLLLRPRKSIQG